MKQEELKTKNLSALEDETLKYIFVTIMEGNDIVDSRNKLANELGLSKRMISAKFREASKIVSQRINENKEMELKQYIKKCYDRDEFLSLEKIADYHNVDMEELKGAFEEYVASFTKEESEIADRFGFSPEALKKGNVQTLQFRVRGFSSDLKYPDQVFYSKVREQDIQFLKSVGSIYDNYKVNTNKNAKIKN